MVLLGAYRLHRVTNDRPAGSRPGHVRDAVVGTATHFYAGTHSPPYWTREFRRSLPMLLDALRTADDDRPGADRPAGVTAAGSA